MSLFGLMTTAERAASKFLLVLRKPVAARRVTGPFAYFNHFYKANRSKKLYNIALYEEYTIDFACLRGRIQSNAQ